MQSIEDLNCSYSTEFKSQKPWKYEKGDNNKANKN